MLGCYAFRLRRPVAVAVQFFPRCIVRAFHSNGSLRTEISSSPKTASRPVEVIDAGNLPGVILGEPKLSDIATEEGSLVEDAPEELTNAQLEKRAEKRAKKIEARKESRRRAAWRQQNPGIAAYLGLVTLPQNALPGITYDIQSSQWLVTDRRELGDRKMTEYLQYLRFEKPPGVKGEWEMNLWRQMRLNANKVFAKKERYSASTVYPKSRRGVLFGTASKMFDLISAETQYLQKLDLLPNMHDSVLDPADTRIHVETLNGQLALLWVSVAAPLEECLHTIQGLADNSEPLTRRNDRLTAVMAGLANLFCLSKGDNRKAKILWDLNPYGKDFPVVLACFDEYVLFTWHGGHTGALVMQYSGNWIPLLAEDGTEVRKTKKTKRQEQAVSRK